LAKKRKNHRLPDQDYRNLVLLCVALVQVAAIALIRFWPEIIYEPSLDLEVYEQEMVMLDDIEITRQQTSPPPPPRPQMPNPVPDDEIIEVEIEFDVDLNLPDMPLPDPGFGTGHTGDEERIVANPQIPPTVVRIVEASAPERVPDEYRGKLEMIVNFLVDQNGDVEEVSIMEIRLYNNNGGYEELPYVQYGLMDAVLKAAMQWRFRPARQDGETVKAFTRQRFNY
jgi:periplasmic protein TonB